MDNTKKNHSAWVLNDTHYHSCLCKESELYKEKKKNPDTKKNKLEGKISVFNFIWHK